MEIGLVHVVGAVGTVATALGALVALWIRLGKVKRTHDADVERHAVREALQKEALEAHDKRFEQHERRFEKLESDLSRGSDTFKDIYRLLGEINSCVARIDERTRSIDQRLRLVEGGDR